MQNKKDSDTHKLDFNLKYHSRKYRPETRPTGIGCVECLDLGVEIEFANAICSSCCNPQYSEKYDSSIRTKLKCWSDPEILQIFSISQDTFNKMSPRGEDSDIDTVSGDGMSKDSSEQLPRSEDGIKKISFKIPHMGNINFAAQSTSKDKKRDYVTNPVKDETHDYNKTPVNDV